MPRPSPLRRFFDRLIAEREAQEDPKERERRIEETIRLVEALLEHPPTVKYDRTEN